MSITCQNNTILVYIGLNKLNLFLFSFIVWWLENLKSQMGFCSTSLGRAAEIVAQLPSAPHSALRRSSPLITPPDPSVSLPCCILVHSSHLTWLHICYFFVSPTRMKGRDSEGLCIHRTDNNVWPQQMPNKHLLNEWIYTLVWLYKRK